MVPAMKAPNTAWMPIHSVAAAQVKVMMSRSARSASAERKRRLITPIIQRATG